MLKILKNIIGMGKTKEMQHPYFGHLKYIKSKSYPYCYWEGTKTMTKQSALIALRIHADEQGPSREQETFFREIIRDLNPIVHNFSEIVKPHFEVWTQKDYADNFLKEFVCTGMNIPINGNRKNDWEITFTQISDSNFVFSVFFENGSAVNTDLDG